MRVIINALTAGTCRWIIWLGYILGWTVEEWHTVKQYSGSVEIKRLFIGPYIRGILKRISFPIPDTASIELLRYTTGCRNELHIDHQGPHKLSGEITDREWSQTGVILLNTKFTGGVLKFPRLSKTFDRSTQGDLVIFPAGKDSHEFAHTVSTITAGTRYSLVIRFV